MPSSAVPPTHSNSWEPRPKDIKTYPHFDRRVSREELTRLANDPGRVARHAFLPLLLFYEEWTRFRKHNGPIKKKKRPIRYASRTDAAIYARYRAYLAERYEAELIRRGIQRVPIAYRAIPTETNSGANKSNIDFAHDAFTAIRTFGECLVTVVDISSYFESLDHDLIRLQWESLIGHPLTPDHAAVFKSVTRYSVVDLTQAKKRLGLLEKNRVGPRKHARQRKIDTLRSNRYLQLCDMKDFRSKICGQGGACRSLVATNGRNYGIPQGTPISDVIANFYLLDFDQEVNDWVTSRNGVYHRYSDDIIVIMPDTASTDPHDTKRYLQSQISKFGEQLKVQDKKVVIGRFSSSSTNQSYNREFGKASRNGLEYLGFAFDGEKVTLKDATMSNAWRKLRRRSYGFAWRYVKRYRDKGEVWIRHNYPHSQLLRSIIQIVSYGQDTGPESWTFLRYVKRSRKKFADFDTRFLSQTRKYKQQALALILADLDKAIKRHG